MATGETVAKVLRLWAENWPGREVTPETVKLYQRALAEVPDDVLETAALECLKTCTFWPTVAETLARCHLPPKRGLTVAEACQKLLAICPDGASDEELRARLRREELRKRAWGTAHWQETVELDKRLWRMDHPEAVADGGNS